MIEDLGRPAEVSDDDKALFEKNLEEARFRERNAPRTINGEEVIWEALAGSQREFLGCPIFELLFHGSRGGGKTDCLLMSFAKHVGTDLGADWRGVIFKQTYPQLADVIAKGERWFPLIFDGAKFNQAKSTWNFPSGETLLFRHINKPADYWNHHGANLPFIGWEELTNWSTDELYLRMFSCVRTTNPRVPKMVRSTTNPYGPGHTWIKNRFRLWEKWQGWNIQPNPETLDGHKEPPRAAISGLLEENTIMMEADPEYRDKIAASATNMAMAEAWLKGSWDIQVGGMFSDVWSQQYNIVRPFIVPKTWKMDRSFDWGSSAPFSVCWFAESDGSDIEFEDGTTRSTVRGDVFHVSEYYGWSGNPNEGLRMLATDVSKGIIERELAMGWRKGNVSVVNRGPADTSIYDVVNGRSIALDMAKPVNVDGKMYTGIEWTKADKRAGSRINGWEVLRRMMRDAHPEEDGTREKPGFFVVGDKCPQFLRTVPDLARDDKNPDDIDTDLEDHIADAVRYRVRLGHRKVTNTRSAVF